MRCRDQGSVVLRMSKLFICILSSSNSQPVWQGISVLFLVWTQNTQGVCLAHDCALTLINASYKFTENPRGWLNCQVFLLRRVGPRVKRYCSTLVSSAFHGLHVYVMGTCSALCPICRVPKCSWTLYTCSALSTGHRVLESARMEHISMHTLQTISDSESESNE